MAIAVAQFTIFDFHDVQSSPTPPSNPVKEQIWLDTSVHPPFMKVWDGNKWVIANDYSNDINNNKETIKTHTTDISVIKGNITTLIKDTTIVKDGKTILLKDDYNRTVQTVDSMKSTIGNHTTQINQATGDITKVESKVNTVERDLNNISLRVSSTESTTVSLSNQVNKAQNDANTANSKIDNLEIGGRNLALNTESNFSNPYNSFTGVENTCPFLAKVLTDGLHVGDKITVRLIYKYIDIVATPGKISKCWIQGSGDVTNWNSGSFQGSPQLTLSGSGEHEFLYTFTINSDHIKNKYWNLNIRHDFVQSGSVQWKMFKVEHGTKYTDWTPAPEDISSSIKDIDNKITTTNNKVSIIETNLNSITSRVSSVETTTSAINGQVSNLSTRMNSAEQKLTDSSIVATVSSQFYKKGEADSRYASQTQITQLDNKISLKVDKNGIISSINQTPESIKILARLIELNGATSFVSNHTNTYAKIVDACYSIVTENIRSMYIGGWEDSTGKFKPVFYMGKNGFNSNSSDVDGTYFSMEHDGKIQRLSARNKFTGKWSTIEFAPENQQINFIPENKCYTNKPFHFAGGVHVLNENNNITGAFTSAGLFANRITSYTGDTIWLGKNVAFENGAHAFTCNKIYIDTLLCNSDGKFWGNAYSSFKPVKESSGTSYLGTDVDRWNMLYCKQPPNISSDVRTKENIEYIDTDLKTCILENQESTTITPTDMRIFVKEELKITEYNYIGEDKTTFNFIAQDIANTKVGKKFVTKDTNGYLGYDLGAYLNIAIGAMQEEMRVRDKEISELREELNLFKNELRIMKKSV